MSLLPHALVEHFAAEPFLALSRRTHVRDRVAVLMYHEVLADDDPLEAWTAVRERDFRAEMQYLRDHFEILSLDDSLARMSHAAKGRRSGVVVTFDDGYRGNWQTAWPIVEAMKIPITIFVSTAAVQAQTPYWYDRVIGALIGDGTLEIDLRHVDLRPHRMSAGKNARARWEDIQHVLTDLKRLPPALRERITSEIVEKASGVGPTLRPMKPLTIENIQEMARSSHITFGAHSHGHEILTQLDLEQARESITKSKMLLEQWTLRPVRHFAYPNGDFNGEIIRLVKESGFASSQGTEQRLWHKRDSVFAIPRLSVGRYDSLNRFRTRVSGLGF